MNRKSKLSTIKTIDRRVKLSTCPFPEHKALDTKSWTRKRKHEQAGSAADFGGRFRTPGTAHRVTGGGGRGLHTTPYTLHPTPYTLHPTPFTLHPSPYTLHPTPYTLHPTPYTIHHTPYTLHPTPYALHPTLYTLHPTTYTLPYRRVVQPMRRALSNPGYSSSENPLDASDRRGPCSVYSLQGRAYKTVKLIYKTVKTGLWHM